MGSSLNILLDILEQEGSLVFNPTHYLYELLDSDGKSTGKHYLTENDALGAAIEIAGTFRRVQVRKCGSKFYSLIEVQVEEPGIVAKALAKLTKEEKQALGL